MKLFILSAFIGFFIMLALYLWQDIGFEREDAQKQKAITDDLEGIEMGVQFLEKRMDQAKRPMLKGLDGK